MKRKSKEATFDRILRRAIPTAFEDGKVVTANANIPVDMLAVDMRYQRTRNPITYRKLVNNWDIRKYVPVVVVPHKDTEKFFLIDGQGRWLAAREKGITELNATILMDPINRNMSQTERLCFESELFAEQNTAVHRLCDVEKHKARLLQGDSAAMVVEDTCQKYGIHMTRSHNGVNSKPGQCANYGAVYGIAKTTSGMAEMDFIFGCMEDAKYNFMPRAYTRNIIVPLHYIYQTYFDDIDSIRRVVASELRKERPADLVAKAIQRYPKKETAAVALYLDDAIAARLHQGTKIKRY